MLYWKGEPDDLEAKMELPETPSGALAPFLQSHQLERLEKQLLTLGAYTPDNLLDLREYHVQVGWGRGGVVCARRAVVAAPRPSRARAL